MCPAEILSQNPSPCTLPTADPLPGQFVMAVLGLSLSAVSSASTIFGSERTIFWRESSAELKTLPYFIAKTLAHTLNILVGSLCYLALFYQLVTPFASFQSMYFIAFFTYWTAASLGYIVSIVFNPSQSQLWGVLAILLSMNFSGMNPRFQQLRKIFNGILYYPSYLSFIRFAIEAFYINEITHYTDIYDNVQSGMDLYEYDISHYTMDMVYVISIGVVGRIIAYLALLLLYRDKRK